MDVVVVDYGLGNLWSVRNAFEFVGANVIVSSDPAEVAGAKRLVLPGVGSFGAGMRNLREGGLVDALNEAVVNRGIPLLGICLGMQMLLNSSEEGQLNGLGLIEGGCKKFKHSSDLKVPHMSWNRVIDEGRSNLLSGIKDPRFYFVHSYYAEPLKEEHIMFSTIYGKKFASGIKRDNILGVQFHPEKSHKYGLSLMQNFLNDSI